MYLEITDTRIVKHPSRSTLALRRLTKSISGLLGKCQRNNALGSNVVVMYLRNKAPSENKSHSNFMSLNSSDNVIDFGPAYRFLVFRLRARSSTAMLDD